MLLLHSLIGGNGGTRKGPTPAPGAASAGSRDVDSQGIAILQCTL